jgi:flagellar biosynthetic protein FliR
VTGVQLAVGEATLAAFVLALARAAGFVLVAAPFNSRSVPVQARVGLAIALALVMSTAHAGTPTLDSTALVVTVVLQVATGMILGFLVTVAVSAVQMAGDLLDTVGGFSISMAMDPLMLVQTSVMGRLHQYTAFVLLFVTDGHLLIVHGLTRGMQQMPGPLTSWGEAARLAGEMLSSMFLAGLQIAAPIVAATLVADIALGLLTRAAPALNAFSLDYPLKILFTLLLASLVITRIPESLATLVREATLGGLSLTGGG